MKSKAEPFTILVAEDDPDDRMMILEGFEQAGLDRYLAFVEDGEELLAALHARAEQTSRRREPPVGVILLDLNMPRMDGREALRILKSDPDLHHIPVVVLTTSQAREDVAGAYGLGVNSFITKPATFSGFADLAKVFGRYWFEVVALPVGPSLQQRVI